MMVGHTLEAFALDGGQTAHLHRGSEKILASTTTVTRGCADRPYAILIDRTLVLSEALGRGDDAAALAFIGVERSGLVDEVGGVGLVCLTPDRHIRLMVEVVALPRSALVAAQRGSHQRLTTTTYVAPISLESSTPWLVSAVTSCRKAVSSIAGNLFPRFAARRNIPLQALALK